MSDAAWTAATTGWVPNSPQVNELVAVTDNDNPQAREVFVKALNQNAGDSSVVLNEYFSASDFNAFATKYTYDATAWDTDRMGMPGLTVQGPDEHPPTTWEDIERRQGLSAPSRPPSRNRSPLNNVADWQIETALGIDPQTNTSNEDDDLQKAIALSMQDSSTPQEPQQTGIAPASESFQTSPFFGPTNRNDHNVDEWAMVRASAQQMDSQPSARKREGGSPVFLRCRHAPSSNQLHRLGPFIMLLHSIPASRNFFLLLNDDADSGPLGTNNGWWRGDHIFARTSTNNDRKISQTDELKRLMAFLDISDRSYGTADSLDYRFAQANFNEPIVRLFESLYNNTPKTEQSRLWTSVKTDTAGSIAPQDFGILDFHVDQSTPEPLRTLYGQWDRLFWTCPVLNCMDDLEDKPPSFAYIYQAARVMTIRVTLNDGVRVEIPEDLFIDRYLEKNVAKTRSMRDQMSVMWRGLGQYATAIAKLTQVRTKTGHTADSRAVLRTLIRRSENAIRQVRARALWKKHEKQYATATKQQPFSYLPAELEHLLNEVELDEADQEDMKQLQIEIQQCKARLARFERIISRITTERDACVANLNRLNQTFTVPSDNESLNPTHKYTLRGVITSMNNVYMKRHKEAEAFEEVDKDAVVSEWCMVSWDGNENQVKHEVVNYEKVKEAMWHEPDAQGLTSPILLYATQEALNETRVELTHEQQTFVKLDNRLFKQEVLEQPEQPEQREKKRVGFRDQQSPAKRQRSNSGDSMDSNRASLGDLSESDLKELMADQMMDNFGGSSNDSGIDTEMMDMPIISNTQLDEIAAHMPPTPSLSADGSLSDSQPIRRSTEQLANMSLDEPSGDGGDNGRAPPREMEQLQQVPQQAPFLVRRPASAQGGGQLTAGVSSMPSWPDIDESSAIPGGSNPEEFYHPPT